MKSPEEKLERELVRKVLESGIDLGRRDIKRGSDVAEQMIKTWQEKFRGILKDCSNLDNESEECPAHNSKSNGPGEIPGCTCPKKDTQECEGCFGNGTVVLDTGKHTCYFCKGTGKKNTTSKGCKHNWRWTGIGFVYYCDKCEKWKTDHSIQKEEPSNCTCPKSDKFPNNPDTVKCFDKDCPIHGCTCRTDYCDPKCPVHEGNWINKGKVSPAAPHPDKEPKLPSQEILEKASMADYERASKLPACMYVSQAILDFLDEEAK